MRNIEVCKKCQHYVAHKTARPNEELKQMIPYVKNYCQIDNKGLEMTKIGVIFRECDFLLEDFIKLKCPVNCPYILEHTVIKGDENEDD